MTSPEKIEELLQYFGQTLEDLPKLQRGCIAVYDREKRAEILKAAKKWHCRKDSGFYEIEDFACHQSDVIEKLVAALEKAVKLYNTTAIMINGITAQDLDEFIGLATNLQLT